MTKEIYQLNKNNYSFLLYEFYKEKFNKEKHKPFLSQEELFTFLPLWGNVGNIMNMIVNYYDKQFK